MFLVFSKHFKNVLFGIIVIFLILQIGLMKKYLYSFCLQNLFYHSFVFLISCFHDIPSLTFVVFFFLFLNIFYLHLFHVPSLFFLYLYFLFIFFYFHGMTIYIFCFFLTFDFLICFFFSLILKIKSLNSLSSNV